MRWIKAVWFGCVIAAVCLFLFGWLPAWCRGTTIDSLDSVCRIKSASSYGTGVVFEISQGQVYVLTNAHVVESTNAVTCNFWWLGHQSIPLPGEVILRAADVDAAVVAIPENAFGGFTPRPTPVAPREYRLRPGETIVSAGCAGAAWATAFRGHFTGYEGDRLVFLPPPANGRSGSPIINANGRIVGLVRARNDQDAVGYAVTVQGLYRALGREAVARNELVARLTQVPNPCPPGCQGCPIGKPPMGAPPQPPRYRLLPYRQGQEQHQQLTPVFPTLPPPAAAPIVPIAPPIVSPLPPPESVKPEGASPVAVGLATLAGLALACLVYFSTPK